MDESVTKAFLGRIRPTIGLDNPVVSGPKLTGRLARVRAAFLWESDQLKQMIDRKIWRRRKRWQSNMYVFYDTNRVTVVNVTAEFRSSFSGRRIVGTAKLDDGYVYEYNIHYPKNGFAEDYLKRIG